MSSYNDIGIDSTLDWNRIRMLFIIGLTGGCMTFVGDWLLGYGVYDESLTGPEKKLSQYLVLSDGKLFWSAFLGLIGISLEGLCYFSIYRLIASGSIPMPGMLIPVSPGSVPVTEAEKSAIQALDKRDIMIPAEYMYTARDVMSHGRDIPEKYLATAHGDFRDAPMTHFYYGSAETLYAFAPSYADSYRKAGAKCVIHVGKGMHHCYALQYFIPGCKPAFNEVMRLIQNYFRKKEKR